MKFLQLLMSWFAWASVSDIPTDEKKLSLTEEQEAQLKEMLSDKQYERFIEGANKELELHANTEDKEKLKQDLLAALEDEDAPPEAKEEITKKIEAGEEVSSTDFSKTVQGLLKDMKKIKELNKELQANVEKLSEEDEVEPKAVELKTKKIPMKHSATHLFSTKNSFDAIEGRPWNKMAMLATTGDVKAAQETFNSFKDTSDVAPIVNNLNKDLNDYYATNPKELVNLKYDTFGLPANWKKRTGVVDIWREVGIRPGKNLTQGRKAGWAPKGSFSLEVEEGMVYPIQIDTEWLGIKLMELAETWLQDILMNPDSGSYEQTRFVVYMVNMYNKQREEEDNQYSVTGVYVKHPNENKKLSGDFTVEAGNAENRQHGLMVLAWIHRNIQKKIKPIKVGMTPTPANIDKYLVDYIERLPLEVRKANGLATYVSWDLFLAYVKKVGMYNPAKDEYQRVVTMTMAEFKDFDYSNLVANVVGYKNQKLIPLPQIGNTNFIFTTWDDNVEIMENKPEEKVKWNFEKQRRDFFGFVDYKMGIRFIFVGNENIPLTDSNKLLSQHVWTNDQEVFEANFSVPVYDYKDGVMTTSYKKVHVDEAWGTDVTKINLRKDKYNVVDYPAGEIVYIQGNPNLAAAKYLKKANTTLGLESDFNLKTEGSITLLSLGNGSFKELKRTSEAPAQEDNVVEFTMDAIDANQSSEFKFVGTDATTLANITGGVEGQQITISGNATAALTVSNNDHISVGTNVTVNASTSVTLVYANGVWYKV